MHCTAGNENHTVLWDGDTWRKQLVTILMKTQSQTWKNSITLDDEVGEFGNLYYSRAIWLICMVWTRVCNSLSAGLAPLVRVSPRGICIETTQTDLILSHTRVENPLCP